MLSNIYIYGLVTRSSSTKRMPLKPLRCAGLYKTEGACCGSPEVVTKPSPYTLGAFCLAITKTPQSGLANGPKWAALNKHRMPRKGEPEKTSAQGASMIGGPADSLNDSLNGDVGRQGRADGVHQPFKSSEFDNRFSGIWLWNNLRNQGVSPNPCIRQSMEKTNA